MGFRSTNKLGPISVTRRRTIDFDKAVGERERERYGKRKRGRERERERERKGEDKKSNYYDFKDNHNLTFLGSNL